MKTKKNNQSIKDCSKKILAVRDALDIFSGKWKIPIIGALIHFREMGFKDLQRTIDGITPKMLSKELKDLEMNQLITRTVLDTRPVTVIYAITDYGETCQDIIYELYNWGVKHRQKIMHQTIEEKT
ncbi:winged helix-turn-helix transcriptional regulator [Aureispira anguillae]|uniref:Helix-turn-helix transcriptional regulator n=1 Tax=Aureispira anguillae TaxID=2864201 RepID=A0A915YBZ6_9BACT|nr:helix-turn-helix domain-containing protein [Aureispira anguillae]BDS10264.1 helix-turn-helix transcriptional regulator [Aureispira anguillae]